MFMLLQYRSNVALGRRYLELNAITHLTVERHNLGEPGFRLWEMSGENTGFPTDYRRKADAIADARKAALLFDLPLSIR